MSSLVASRYARAILEALWPQRALAGLQQLRTLSGVFDEQPDVPAALSNPALPLALRRQLLDKIGAQLGFEVSVLNLLNLLIERKRLGMLSDVCAAYQKLLDEREGIAYASVTAAVELGPEEQNEIAAKLKKLTGKDIRMELHVDPALIGGVVAQVGSTVYDGSLKQQLHAFRNRFTEK